MGRQVSDESIASIEKLSHLVDLSLYGTSVSDRGIKSVPKQLRRLSIFDCPITSTGVVVVSELKGLGELRIVHCDIDEDACKAIGELVNLHTLSLSETNVSDKGWREIASTCKRLKKVNAYASNLSWEGATSLLAMPELKDVNIGHTKLSDFEIKSLRRLYGNISILDSTTSP